MKWAIRIPAGRKARQRELDIARRIYNLDLTDQQRAQKLRNQHPPPPDTDTDPPETSSDVTP